jgi:hypothetical protein
MAARVYPGAERLGSYLAITTGKTERTTLTSVMVLQTRPQKIANPGFERGFTGWRIREKPGYAENHVIDRTVAHSGAASARIDAAGYYYSQRLQVNPGSPVTARWWARCTSPTGSQNFLHYWRGNQLVAKLEGPPATRDPWTPYELSDVVPKGAEQVSLAFQFFGEGQCWFDDVEVAVGGGEPDVVAPRVTALARGENGAIVELEGSIHILLCGAQGTIREHHVASHHIQTDAELTVVSITPDGPKAFVSGGSLLRLDGEDLDPVRGAWRAKEQRF